MRRQWGLWLWSEGGRAIYGGVVVLAGSTVVSWSIKYIADIWILTTSINVALISGFLYLSYADPFWWGRLRTFLRHRVNAAPGILYSDVRQLVRTERRAFEALQNAGAFTEFEDKIEQLIWANYNRSRVIERLVLARRALPDLAVDANSPASVETQLTKIDDIWANRVEVGRVLEDEPLTTLRFVANNSLVNNKIRERAAEYVQRTEDEVRRAKDV